MYIPAAMDADELETVLNGFAEPEYREFSLKLTPGADRMLGVRSPRLWEIAKEICNSDWRKFLSYPSRSHEHTMIRAKVIGTARMGIDERIGYTEEFLPEVTNWAVNDCLCSSWKLSKKDDPEKLWDYCVELVGRHQEFPSRVGAVMMLTHFIDDEHVDRVNDILVSCPRCGYYLDMGVAWTLSMCYVRFPERTEEVLFDGRLETEVLRMTVRKICDSYRADPSDKERLKARLKELTRRSS